MKKIIGYLSYHSFNRADEGNIAYVCDKFGMSRKKLDELLDSAIAAGFIEPESNQNWLIATREGREFAGIDESEMYEGFLITLIRHMEAKRLVHMSGLYGRPEEKITVDVIKYGINNGYLEGIISTTEKGRKYAGLESEVTR